MDAEDGSNRTSKSALPILLLRCVVAGGAAEVASIDVPVILMTQTVATLILVVTMSC